MSDCNYGDSRVVKDVVYPIAFLLVMLFKLNHCPQNLTKQFFLHKPVAYVGQETVQVSQVIFRKIDAYRRGVAVVRKHEISRTIEFKQAADQAEIGFEFFGSEKRDPHAVIVVKGRHVTE